MEKIFEPKTQIKVNDLTDLNLEELLQETFTIRSIQTENRSEDGTLIAEVTNWLTYAYPFLNSRLFQYFLIPRAVLSLKVLQELPIIVVLMYQLYKQDVHQGVSDFIPLIMKTITLHPALELRQMDNFNKETFVDFMGAQIKTLSFMAYIIKSYIEVVSGHIAWGLDHFLVLILQAKNHADLLVQGMLDLLTLCPMEVSHLRRELLIAARHILATDLRTSKWTFC